MKAKRYPPSRLQTLLFACMAGSHAGTRASCDCILLSATLSDMLLHHSGAAEKPVFDLSAWGPNLLKLERGCSVSGAAGPPASGCGGSAMTATDRRPRQTSRCSGAASQAEEEKPQSQCRNYSEFEILWARARCGPSLPPSISAALAVSHTTSSLTEHILPLI